MSYEHILIARTLIAKVGERNQLNWWESDAHTTAAGAILTRLFPRTANWAAVEMAISAATAAHRRDLPPVRVLTLFDLGEEVNQGVQDLLLHQKQAGSLSLALAGNLAPANLSADLASSGLTSDVLLRKAREQTARSTIDRAVCVGEATAEAAPTSQRLIGLLVAGYQFCSQDRFVVPYIRVV